MRAVGLHQFVVFNYRIGEKVATKAVQPLLKIGMFSFDIDFHIFADPNAADFRHAKVTHCVANRISLRIEHSLFRFDDYIDFHVSHANADFLRNKRKAVPLRH